jgi:sterol desaturase/sphingolipid hydroxylase (fatty acid hydroxylase superfamily)
MPTSLGLPLPTLLVDVLRLSLWLTILVAVFIPLERLFAAHPQKILRKGLGTDLCYYFLSGLFSSALLSLPIAALAWLVHAAIPSGFLEATAAMPLWARAGVGMIAGELGYYWGHRWSHEIPFLWRFHAIHHSAEEVDFLVNTRAHPVDLVFGRFCGLVPIYVLGLGGPAGPEGSVVPILVSLIGIVWGFFIHANLRWRFGPVEWLIATPAFHHWHHTRSGPINRNYASTLPWIDRLFGTHHLPGEFPANYGIEARLPDSLPEQILFPLLSERDAPAYGRPEAASSRTLEAPAGALAEPQGAGR